MAAVSKINKDDKDSIVGAQEAYYLHPFAQTTQQPKIPDGKMNTSIGVQNNLQSEITTEPADDSLYATYYFVLYPGWNLAMTVYKKTHGTQFAAMAATIDTNSGYWRQNPTNNTRWDSTPNSPCFWRMVSQGMRITALESSANIQGHFESVSLPVNIQRDETTYSQQPVGTGENCRFIRPTNEYIEKLEENTQLWRNSKTYTSGTLEELKNLVFRQVVNDTDHTPKPIDSYFFSETEVVNHIDSTTDSSFQMRIVRIRTRGEQELLVNIVVNKEYQFPFTASIKGFETLNDNNVNMEDLNEIVEANERTQGVIVSPEYTRNRPISAINRVVAYTKRNNKSDYTSPAKRTKR